MPEEAAGAMYSNSIDRLADAYTILDHAASASHFSLTES